MLNKLHCRSVTHKKTDNNNSNNQTLVVHPISVLAFKSCRFGRRNKWMPSTCLSVICGPFKLLCKHRKASLFCKVFFLFFVFGFGFECGRVFCQCVSAEVFNSIHFPAENKDERNANARDLQHEAPWLEFASLSDNYGVGLLVTLFSSTWLCAQVD